MNGQAGAVIEQLTPQKDARSADSPKPRIFGVMPELTAALRAPQIMTGPAIFAEEEADEPLLEDLDLSDPLPRVA